VIPITGVISHRMNLLTQFSGGTSTAGLTKAFRAALADPNVKAIVFDVDSPGGSVDGVAELADEILQARGQKKMVAVCNSLMASAAYWIASAADEVVFTSSGSGGSIGVFMVHEDYSEANKKMGIAPTYISAGKYKTEGNPDEPLSDDARAAMQADVDAFYSMFVNAVAKGRGVSASDVRSGFGQGRCLLAKDALKAGMCDKIATLDQTLARFGAGDQVTKVSASEEEHPSPQAAAPAKAENDDGCDCECAACVDDNCAECTMDNCEDPACAENGCPQQMNDSESSASDDAATPDYRIELERLRLELLDQS
jgi:signal peptide peptidase SppA